HDLTKGKGRLGFLETRYHVVERLERYVHQGGAKKLLGLSGAAISVTTGVLSFIVGAVTVIPHLLHAPRGTGLDGTLLRSLAAGVAATLDQCDHWVTGRSCASPSTSRSTRSLKKQIRSRIDRASRSGSGYVQARSSWSVSPARTCQYEATPLYAQRVFLSLGSRSSIRTSSAGR